MLTEKPRSISFPINQPHLVSEKRFQLTDEEKVGCNARGQQCKFMLDKVGCGIILGIMVPAIGEELNKSLAIMDANKTITPNYIPSCPRDLVEPDFLTSQTKLLPGVEMSSTDKIRLLSGQLFREYINQDASVSELAEEYSLTRKMVYLGTNLGLSVALTDADDRGIFSARSIESEILRRYREPREELSGKSVSEATHIVDDPLITMTMHMVLKGASRNEQFISDYIRHVVLEDKDFEVNGETVHRSHADWTEVDCGPLNQDQKYAVTLIAMRAFGRAKEMHDKTFPEQRSNYEMLSR